MSAKEVKFGVDARDRVLRGVDILNNAVKVSDASMSSSS
jgi:chaperonin GroEL